MSVLSLTMAGANAAGGLLYDNPGAQLRCETEATCGDYKARHPVEVYSNGSERQLYWNLNVPAGIDGGRYLAHTIGGACPAGSVLDNMTAQWTLASNGKPLSAKATHCDGVTVSEFSIRLLPEIDPRDCIFNPSLCPRDDF